MKRWRKPTAKPGQLKIAYGQEYGDKDLFFCWGQGTCRADSSMLNSYFCYHKGFEGRTLVEELEKRGYDITTLKFSIELKPRVDNEG